MNERERSGLLRTVRSALRDYSELLRLQTEVSHLRRRALVISEFIPLLPGDLGSELFPPIEAVERAVAELEAELHNVFEYQRAAFFEGTGLELEEAENVVLFGATPRAELNREARALTQ